MKKQKLQIDDTDNDTLPFQPPEIKYIADRHVVKIPIDDPHFSGSPWELRLFATKLVEREVGDEVQVTSIEIKQPSPLTKSVVGMFGRVPNARVYATVKF
jgi:hypothetical protein